MNLKDVIMDLLPWLISALVFVLMITFSASYHPEKEIIKTYQRINNRLREKKNKVFDYERIKAFLLANGASYHYGKWIEPVKYYALRLALAAIFFYITVSIHWIFVVPGVLLGFYLPQLLLIYLNSKDNNKMLQHIYTVYNALSVLIKSGVYISDAVAECYDRLPKGRLRYALEELSGELFLKKSFSETVGNFNGKFNNDFIDSLCIILIQGQESGKSVELLQDMSEQIKEMQKSLYAKKKRSLDNFGTICVVIILGLIITIIVYALITEWTVMLDMSL